MLDSTTGPVNPDDYIITKKRKKYKFALFANSPLCYEYDEWTKRAVDVVEIGAGTGLFSVEQATLASEKQFVAIDVKADRLQKGAHEAARRGLTNIRFLRARADQIGGLFDTHCVEILWLTFSDPFPKKRSAGRRLTHPTYLAYYQEVLARNGSLFIKHDNPAFFQWSLEQLVAAQWSIAELSFDLHDSTLSEIYKIKTDYEERWLSEGLRTQFVRARMLH